MPEAGEYTKLQERIPNHPKDGVVWMSDTPAELIDHLPAARRIADPSTKRVLIMGLGLGCIAKLAASFDHVEQIYVVERDARVIKLVGRWFKDERVHVIEGDAYDLPVGPSEHWDVIWHDIWPHIDEENLLGMHYLHHKYREHCTWQGMWALELCMMQQDVDRELFREVKRREGKMPGPTHELWELYVDFLEFDVHYTYFVEHGYKAESREGHPSVLDDLPNHVGSDGTHWGVL
jgi:hypothetical protein